MKVGSKYHIGECYWVSEIDIDRLQDQGNPLASKHRLHMLLPTEDVSPLAPLFRGSHALSDLLPTTAKICLNDQTSPPAHPPLPIVDACPQGNISRASSSQVSDLWLQGCSHHCLLVDLSYTPQERRHTSSSPHLSSARRSLSLDLPCIRTVLPLPFLLLHSPLCPLRSALIVLSQTILSK